MNTLQIANIVGAISLAMSEAVLFSTQGEAPERNWRVEDLAAVAGMSRSAFSNLFHGTVGEPPASYLQSWRISLVQK